MSWLQSHAKGGSLEQNGPIAVVVCRCQKAVVTRTTNDKVPWGGSSWGSHVGKFPIISTISGNEPSIQELSELVELVSLVGRMRQHKQDQKGSRGHTVTKVKSNTAKGRGGGNQWKKLQLPPAAASCIRRSLALSIICQSRKSLRRSRTTTAMADDAENEVSKFVVVHCTVMPILDH